MKVTLISGDVHVDERGILSFVNDFDFKGVDPFYTIRAHQPGEIRGWVGHRRDHKWFVPLVGSMVIAVVAPDDWENPSGKLPVQRFTLSKYKPAVLHVPPGHATASIMLTQDALLGVFSSGKIEDAANDEWRFDKDMWEI
jgi:dTDP-4-dehydrorhamnose 3,5-epimerase